MCCGSNVQTRCPVSAARTAAVCCHRSALFEVAMTGPGASRTAGTARQVVLPERGAQMARTTSSHVARSTGPPRARPDGRAGPNRPRGTPRSRGRTGPVARVGRRRTARRRAVRPGSSAWYWPRAPNPLRGGWLRRHHDHASRPRRGRARRRGRRRPRRRRGAAHRATACAGPRRRPGPGSSRAGRVRVRGRSAARRRGRPSTA